MFFFNILLSGKCQKTDEQTFQWTANLASTASNCVVTLFTVIVLHYIVIVISDCFT